MLQTLNQPPTNAIAYLPPFKICEACGKQIDVAHNAINVIITIGSPGHPDLPPFQCPHTEHWACSPECWGQVAHACIDEHIQPMLNYQLSQLKGA